MAWVNPPAEDDRVTPWAGVLLLTTAVAAVVLSNQQNELSIFGRLLHFASIAAAGVVLVQAHRTAVFYLAACAALFVVGTLGYRLPYVAFLCLLFLGAGAILGAAQRDRMISVIIAISLVSGFWMLLQVLGVGEWTQFLTTHGIGNDGAQVSKEQFWTLFRGVNETEANFLQGRPSGLLHSNQFASLFLLFTIAMSLARRGPRSLFLDAALCVAAVLSMAKVVFLGMAVMFIFQFLFGGREGRAVSIRFGFITAIALGLYALLFPGLIQTYLLNWSSIWQSIATRATDFAVAIGISDGSVVSYLLDEDLNMGLYESGKISKEALLGIAEVAREAKGDSVISVLWRSSGLLYGAIAALALVCSTNVFAARWIHRHVSQQHLTVLLALSTFCLAANFFNAPIFWLFVGFGVPAAILSPQQHQTSGS